MPNFLRSWGRAGITASVSQQPETSTLGHLDSTSDPGSPPSAAAAARSVALALPDPGCLVRSQTKYLGGGAPFDALFAVPGLEDLPTLGVFLNAPDRTSGFGGELEIRADPWDWLNVSVNYSRRKNRQAEVRDFVEQDDLSAEQRLVPTFGRREFFVDQASGVFTFRKEDDFWASLRLRFLVCLIQQQNN